MTMACFPAARARGHIAGPQPADAAERKALAVLYTALLTVECLDALGSSGRVILDGSFLRDPLYAGLVAALRPKGDTVSNLDTYGVASGTALLASHGTRPGARGHRARKAAGFRSSIRRSGVLCPPLAGSWPHRPRNPTGFTKGPSQ